MCVSNELGIGEMVFEIKYDKKTVDGLATSRLYLHENVYKINGYYINTIRTLIAEYKAPVDDYLDKSFEYYNVVLDEDNAELDQDKYKYLMARKHYAMAVFKKISAQLNEMFDKFIKFKIKCLKELNSAFSKAVINTYNSEKKSIEERFLDENQDVVAYNELLDKAIEDNYAITEEFQIGGDKYFHAVEPAIERLAIDYDELETKGKAEVAKSLPKEDSKIISELEEEQKSVTKGGSAQKYGMVLNDTIIADASGVVSQPDINKMRDKINNIGKIIAKSEGRNISNITKQNKTAPISTTSNPLNKSIKKSTSDKIVKNEANATIEQDGMDR